MASIARPPHGLHETAIALMRQNNLESSDQGDDDHPQDPPLARSSDIFDGQHERNESTASHGSKPRSPRQSSQIPRWSINTPSTRTGPPRSISYNYTSASSHPASRENSGDEQDDVLHINLPSPSSEGWEDPDHAGDFAPARSPFRGALEYSDPDQREKEREIAEKRSKNKRRESFSYFHDVFNPSRWTTDSPREDHATPSLLRRDSRHQGEETSSPAPGSPILASTIPESIPQDDSETRHVRMGSLQSPVPSAASPSLGITGRSKSLPHVRMEGKQEARPSTAPRWNRIRSLIPSLASRGRETTHAPSAITPQSVNITDELITGGLSTLLLRFWFERDEKGHRRVPLLFHRLRIRVSDSLHPLHGNKAVFRIECEYANGAARWVVYRQLREFISLHTHYTFAYKDKVETLPNFPSAGMSQR